MIIVNRTEGNENFKLICLIRDVEKELRRHSFVEKCLSKIGCLKISERSEVPQLSKLRGYFLKNNIISLFVGNCENQAIALYVFLHELGHAIRWNNGLVPPGYSAKNKNHIFYEEEIKADEFAVSILANERIEKLMVESFGEQGVSELLDFIKQRIEDSQNGIMKILM